MVRRQPRLYFAAAAILCFDIFAFVKCIRRSGFIPAAIKDIFLHRHFKIYQTLLAFVISASEVSFITE